MQLETKIAAIPDGDSLLRNIVLLNNVTFFLLFIDGCTTALITYSHCLYWFDSRSRDELGFRVACETSVLLKFRNLREVQRYIQVAYLGYSEIQRLYSQIQFSRLNLSATERSNTYSQYRLNITRSNYQRKPICSKRNKTGQKSMKKLKRKKRFDACRNYQNSKCTRNRDFSKEKSCQWKNQVLTLKQQITKRPYFVCVVCNRFLYRRSVINFKNKNYEVDSCIYFYIESFDGDCYICKTCNKQLKKGKSMSSCVT